MKKIAKIMTLVFFIVLSIISLAYAPPPSKGPTDVNIPIWKIIQGGKAVQWVDHEPNRRFAIYDPGTPDNALDDVVFDKETGLVWERSPSTYTYSWSDAIWLCYGRGTGDRLGWRLPTIEELTSLVYPPGPHDPPADLPYLPTGHPFLNVMAGVTLYWSSTSHVLYPGSAWGVCFGRGCEGSAEKSISDNRYSWCVRGGIGHVGY